MTKWVLMSTRHLTTRASRRISWSCGSEQRTTQQRIWPFGWTKVPRVDWSITRIWNWFSPEFDDELDSFSFEHLATDFDSFRLSGCWGKRWCSSGSWKLRKERFPHSLWHPGRLQEAVGWRESGPFKTGVYCQNQGEWPWTTRHQDTHHPWCQTVTGHQGH